jgi:hypothetical protein
MAARHRHIDPHMVVRLQDHGTTPAAATNDVEAEFCCAFGVNKVE